MTVRELRTMTDEKLLDLIDDKKQNLFTMRQQFANGELKDTSTVRETRRDIARILTILHERQAGAKKGS